MNTYSGVANVGSCCSGIGRTLSLCTQKGTVRESLYKSNSRVDPCVCACFCFCVVRLGLTPGLERCDG